MNAAEILLNYRITAVSSAIGRYHATCPECSHTRKKKLQKCLGVTISEEGVQFGCNHCEWTGGQLYREKSKADRNRIRPPELKVEERRCAGAADSQKKVKWLWSQRQPIVGSIAEKYLRECRGYQGRLPGTLGFLPARGEYPPAMIAAFGTAAETLPGEIIIYDAAVRGVHLTKLKPDGSGKAGTEADKLTIGTGNTSPIWLAPVNDGLGLAIAEGIEDALSLHQGTGLGAWAAGTAGRLPAMAEAVPNYVESVSIAVDRDAVGEKNANELAGKLTARGVEVRLIRAGEAE
jgi:hypothetical protein